MRLKLLLTSTLLALSFTQAAAYTGRIPRLPQPLYCIVGEDCRESCVTDANGEVQCQIYCTLQIVRCDGSGGGDGGGDDCDEVGDDDNAPDECPIETLPSP